MLRRCQTDPNEADHRQDAQRRPGRAVPKGVRLTLPAANPLSMAICTGPDATQTS